MYQIQIYYRTGDSFSEEEVEEPLEFEWENKEMAEEALQRIKEHYKAYNEIENGYIREYEALEKYKNEKWNAEDYTQYNAFKGARFRFSIKLPDDNGFDFTQSVFWVGYFEQLYSAKVVEKEEDLPSFSV